MKMVYRPYRGFVVLPPGTQDINFLPTLCPLTLGCCNRINNRNYVYLLAIVSYGSYTVY